MLTISIKVYEDAKNYASLLNGRNVKKY